MSSLPLSSSQRGNPLSEKALEALAVWSVEFPCKPFPSHRCYEELEKRGWRWSPKGWRKKVVYVGAGYEALSSRYPQIVRGARGAVELRHKFELERDPARPYKFFPDLWRSIYGFPVAADEVRSDREFDEGDEGAEGATE